jgi:hypothetical protein
MNGGNAVILCQFRCDEVSESNADVGPDLGAATAGLIWLLWELAARRS